MIKIKDYQKIGIEFLKSKRYALLADEMGLGKSAQSILASYLYKNILVISPACVVENWKREFIKFNSPTTPTITSFAYLIRNLSQFNRMKWDLVIVDEAHFLKEPTSKRTKAVLGKDGLLHSTSRMWLLSGTPAPNHAGELWVLLYTFGYTKLTYDQYVDRYCNSYRQNRFNNALKITGTNRLYINEVKSLLSKFCLRRKKDQVLKELPSITHNIFYVDAPKDPLKEFKDLKDKVKDEFNLLKEKLKQDLNPDDDKLLNVLMLIGQSISSLRRYHGMQKIDPVLKLINLELEFNTYDKIVIFGVHKDILKTLKDGLSKWHPVSLTGDTPKNKRQLYIDTFQNDKNCRVFIGNIKAAGVGINLTNCSEVLFIEQEWTPGDNAQASMRCHRIGQKKPVNVRYISLSGTFDEKITATLKRKISEISTFIN